MVLASGGTPLVGPGPVNNWLFERKLGTSDTQQKSAADRIQERNSPVAPPAYNPDLAPRPNATARQPVRPPAPISGSSKPSDNVMPPLQQQQESASGILEYHAEEMGSHKWSDSYSFLNSEFDSQRGHNPIGRNFESLFSGAAGAAGGKAAPQQKQQRSQKEEQLLSEFERFQASRDRDVPGPRVRQ
jgi:hypothetical protein